MGFEKAEFRMSCFVFPGLDGVFCGLWVLGARLGINLVLSNRMFTGLGLSGALYTLQANPALRGSIPDSARTFLVSVLMVHATH